MDQLKRLRVERGLSQARLAARAELDPSTVNQIERGAREASSVTLRKLAAALDVSLIELLEADSPKVRAPLPLEPEVAGPLLLERAQDAARQDEDNARKAINRSAASEGMAQSVSSFEEDKFRAELRAFGFPDEYFEGFIWPLVVENMRLKEENAILRDQLQERERAHS